MQRLKRELGLFQVVTAGVGVILGAGIYALIGVASKSSGNATWLAFLISAVVALFTGLSYAELSSMFKGDAGEYDYVKTAFSKKFALFIAVVMIIGTIISSSTVALGFADYFTRLIDVPILLAAVVLILAMALINAIGIRETNRFTTFSTLIELIGLAIIIVTGLKNFGTVDYLAMPLGLKGVFSSAALVFFAYLGFEGIVKLRDETKDPEKTIPRGIVYSILISSVLYVIVAIAAVSSLGWEALSQSKAPLASVAAAVLGSKAFVLLAIIALFSTANTVLLTMVAASRQLYGMAKEASIPKHLAYINERTRTPLLAIIVVAVLTLVFSYLDNIGFVANLADAFLFIVFAVVNLSLLVLRYKRKNMHREFVCPVNIGRFSVIALLGFISSVAMFIFALINLV